MSWRDASELVVANNGEVYFAPVGTPLPQPGDDPTAALDGDFVGAGWITEDGATLTVGSEVTDFGAWQTRQPIRRERTAQEIQFAWTFQQWNEENVVLAFGGGAITDHGGGLYSYTFPEDTDPLEERSLVVDAIDGDVHYRYVFPRGNVTEAVETQFQRGATAVLPITFKVLAPEEGGTPAWFLTDADGFAAGS